MCIIGTLGKYQQNYDISTYMKNFGWESAFHSKYVGNLYSISHVFFFPKKVDFCYICISILCLASDIN